MYKNQLQELAQRSCFNLPSYTCLREGPDHAPRFKATVNFNGEIFESPQYCSTLRQAEHSAAEVALSSLSHRGPSHSLAAKILLRTQLRTQLQTCGYAMNFDTAAKCSKCGSNHICNAVAKTSKPLNGVYKNLLQEIAQRVGAPLPQYTTFRSGLGHLPVFTGTVELAGITFTGEHAKNKKQAEKNAAMAAWSSLKQLAKETASSSTEPDNNDELEQITIARALLNYRLKEKMAMSNPNALISFPNKFQFQNPRPTSPQPRPATSKILPLICQKTVPRSRHPATAVASSDHNSIFSPLSSTQESRWARRPKFPAAGAAPYVPIRHMRSSCQGIAPPVTIRNAIPVFSPPPAAVSPQVMRPLPIRVAPPINIRQAVPVFAAAPQVRKDEPVPISKDDPAQALYAATPLQVDEPVPISKVDPAPAVYAAPPVLIDEPVTVSKVDLAPAENAAVPVPVDESVPISKDDPAAPAVKKDEPVLISKNDPAPTNGADTTDTKTENIPAESETAQRLEQLKI